ncbi:MAG: hypothetical protein QOG52_1395 [Frankiaceae bacterium]|nr:hypothetical protein [Frankiaceae bacterium]
MIAPCNTDTPQVALHAPGVYTFYRAQVTPTSYVAWVAGATTFATPAAAAAAMNSIKSVEKTCPKLTVTTNGGASTNRRIVSGPNTINGWPGYRTVDIFTFTVGKESRTVRTVDQYFTKGNVVVDVTLLDGAHITTTKGAIASVNAAAAAITKQLAAG